MKSADTTKISTAVADLKKQWNDLDDIGRAKAVRDIKEPGISIRGLARQLECSESLIRRLLEVARAPGPLQILVRQRKISVNELLRRSKVAVAGRAAKGRVALERERIKAAQRGCQEICAWLRNEGLVEAYGEAIVDEARRKLAAAESFGKLPACKAPQGTSLIEIIGKLRPPESVNSDVGSVAWYATWLTRWAYFAWPDSSIRDKALGMALAMQINPGIV